MPTILPDPTQLHLIQLQGDDHSITATVATTSVEARCPLCQTCSQRIHSRYVRTVADLPWHGIPLRLHLRVRRFFCDEPTCSRRIFAERLPSIVAPFARRTCRLTDVLEAIGFAAGGQAGARLLVQLGMIASPDTLLRLLRRAVVVDGETPRVLGIDDWSYRRGQRYGTLLVDLERHRPIAILPERNAESVAAWLQVHPGVEIVSRDRSSTYAEGIRLGAPDAIQVADRWHLMRNLGEVFQRLLERHTAALRSVARSRPVESQPAPAQPLTDATAEQVGAVVGHRQQRQHQFAEVKALHAQGWSICQIAKQVQLNWRTVRKYITADQLPQRQGSQTTSSVTPFHAYLMERWDAGCHQGTQLLQELRERGYRGSLASVYRALKRRRSGDGRHAHHQATAPNVKIRSPRQAMWLFLRPSTELEAEDERYREALCASCPDVAVAYPLAQRYLTMIRERQVTDLEPWLSAAEQSGVHELQQFAQGLRHDLAAVQAALTLPWSNGQLEGQINRLKLIKRTMYGRANDDLLCKRVLHRSMS
jgi:transposase